MLVLGGCRSGKSGFAEKWASDRFTRRIMIATMEADKDAELAARIALHRKNRGEGWTVVEEPIHLQSVIAQHENASEIFLVDCVTLWITNLLLRDLSDREIQDTVQSLASFIKSFRKAVIMVANEVGLGLVPESPLGRRFRDLAGWTNQRLAEVCEKVVFMAAGIPLYVKNTELDKP